MTIRNRIKDHRRVRAGDLVPHELNPRTHSDTQKEALRALVGEVGYSRSVLAYVADKDLAAAKAFAARLVESGERPEDAMGQALHRTKLTLIDGHLRQSEFPDEVIDVEVLDVNDDEARKLLLSIDPLAQLAGFDEERLNDLRDLVSTDNDTLSALWSSLDAASNSVSAAVRKTEREQQDLKGGAPEKFLLLVHCKDEKEQVDLLRKFKRQGLKCEAKTC